MKVGHIRLSKGATRSRVMPSEGLGFDSATAIKTGPFLKDGKVKRLAFAIKKLVMPDLSIPKTLVIVQLRFYIPPR